MRKALALGCLTVFFVASLACGHPTQLTGMTISPSSITFSDAVPGMTSQFTAYGTFIHPAETRDITGQVTWSSSTPDIATVDSSGKVTTVGLACGVTVITATAPASLVGSGGSGSVKTATATIDVKLVNQPNCP
jgi:uncharacterized protein YjdB